MTALPLFCAVECKLHKNHNQQEITISPARVFSEEEKEKPRTPSKSEKKRAHDEDQKNGHDRCPFTTRETFFWTCPTNEAYKDYNSQCSHGRTVESDALLGEAVWQKELLLKKNVNRY